MAKTGRIRKKRDWRQVVFIIISVMIVLSMALALLGAFLSPPG